MNQRQILLVEDEQDIAELVALHLGDLCDEAVVASDGHEGMRLATSRDWSLIILDLRLPGPDGLQMIPVPVRRGIQSFAAVVDITAEIGNLIVLVQKECVHMAGQTQTELVRFNFARLEPVP